MKVKKSVSIVLVITIFINIFMLSVGASSVEVSQTGEYTIEITSYEQLKNIAENAQGDCRYVLANDIVQNDNVNDMEIVIGTWSDFTLDLNGYSISRVTSGVDCTLFRVKSGGYMKIMDTSNAKTGYCSFSEGYSSYYKSVFNNDGGELEIVNGYYEIFSPNEQGDCSVLRTTSGYTNIYGGTFDSSSAWGGDTISVGHNAYLYDTPSVIIFGGDFYGKYQNIDVSPFDNYLKYGKEYPDGSLHPYVFVLGGNFYVCNGGKDGESASFAYCNNGWGRVIVAQGRMLAKCLNSTDQRFLDGVTKKFFTDTIDNYTGTYYEVTAPPMMMSDGLDYHYRLINLCYKNMVNSYGASVHEIFKDSFDEILNNIDTVYVDKTEKNSPIIRLENRTSDHKYIRWYMCEESAYCGEDTKWTYLGDFDDVSHWQHEERPENAESYIIRCVVTKSDLSTYEDVIRIVYEPLKETDTIVSFVDIGDVIVPVAGNTPDMSAVCYTQGCNVSDISWYDVTNGQHLKLNATDKLIENHIYCVDITVYAEVLHSFYMVDGYNETLGAVNGERANAYGTHDDKEMTFYYTFAPCESSGDVFKLGDVDCSGEITILDATQIQLHIASLIELSDNQLKLADTDKTGDISIMDATAIQLLIAKIIDKF